MKFIQITTSAHVVDGVSHTPVYALGDDGSVWEFIASDWDTKWRRLTDDDNTGFEKPRGARP
jgi:hypothetical protein